MRYKTIASILLTSSFIYSCNQPKLEHPEPDIIKSVEINLTEISTDPDYGYDMKKPVEVGGIAEKKGHKNQYTYLRQLAGPNGESLSFHRKGLCCIFKTDNGHRGLGFLDIWEIKITASDKTKKIYLNSYNYDTPKSPLGFRIKKVKKN
ncbi:hypothetical protein MNBD_GAMMA11-1515 [hydrothermal vent metagenome]|uniref:2-dehydro-3-deoxyphosphooctonate aldolase n=1 Tax=hydrothermal vent metagenome TaxID=652676 RepID=A0A3B0WRG2_9ZZZZ